MPHSLFSIAIPLSAMLRAAKLCLLLFSIAGLQACTSAPHNLNLNYDFEPISKEDASNYIQANKIVINIADISAPSTLDSNDMLYRLQYDNAQLLRAYAQHHWSMPPAQLFAQRLKSRITAAGGIVVGAADGIADLPILKIELDEFSQIFTNAIQSEAKIALRASIIKKNKLIAQQYFNLGTASTSADASGGAKAMQVTADRSISAILTWLLALPAY